MTSARLHFTIYLASSFKSGSVTSGGSEMAIFTFIGSGKEESGLLCRYHTFFFFSAYGHVTAFFFTAVWAVDENGLHAPTFGRIVKKSDLVTEECTSDK